MTRTSYLGRWTARLSVAVVAGSALIAQGATAHAQEFMGCSLQQWPSDLLACLNRKWQDANSGFQRQLDDARKDLENRYKRGQEDMRKELDQRGQLARSEWEKRTLQARRAIQSDPLLACVAGANPAADVAQVVARYSSDPARFFRAAYDDAMAMVAPPTLTPPPTGIQIMRTAETIFDDAWRRAEVGASRSATLRCIVDHARPMRDAMKRGFVNTAPTFTLAMNQAWSGSGTKVLGDMTADLITKALNKNALGADGVLILKGALTEQLLGPSRIQGHADLVQALTTALPAGGQPMADAAARAKDALGKAFQIDSDFYVSVFEKWLMLAGRKLIRSDSPPVGGITALRPPGGGWVADRLLDQLDWVPASVNSAIASVCGTVPEAGGFVCGWGMQLPLRELWIQIVRPGIKETALSAVEVTYDEAVRALVARLRDPLRRGAGRVRVAAGPIAVALESMQQQLIEGFVDDVVKTTRVALDNFDDRVVELIDAAVAARR
jgi:hypothetical protein